MADTYITTGGAATRRLPPEDSQAPEIGDTRTFIPHDLLGEEGLTGFGRDGDGYVTGVCCYVNTRARWARWEYEHPGGGKAWECFKY